MGYSSSELGDCPGEYASAPLELSPFWAPPSDQSLVVLLGGDSSGLKSSVRSQLTNQQTPRIATQRTASAETIKPLDWKNFYIFYIHSFFAVI